MLQFLFKEASLLLAFVVLGALLLISLWVTQTFQSSLIRDYKNTQISVILKDGSLQKFRDLIEKDPNVIRFDLASGAKNKEKLQGLYPELQNLVAPLEERFFPASAIVAVHDGDLFLKHLKLNGSDLYESQILHQPPREIARLASLLTAIFGSLWLLTLALVLYFNLERITDVEVSRWSLMKMLGAKPYRLFAPLWYGQLARMAIASIVAIGVAFLLSSQIEKLFVWNWISLSAWVWAAFFGISIAMTSAISFGLFYSRFKKVSIG